MLAPLHPSLQITLSGFAMTLGNKASRLFSIPPTSPLLLYKEKRRKPKNPICLPYSSWEAIFLKLLVLRPLKPVEGNGDS